MVEDNFYSQNNNQEGVSPKATRRMQRKAEKQARQAKRNPKPLEPRSKNQADYIKSLKHNDLTFAVGPAGVGKTYIPSRFYGNMLATGQISKLYIARPNIAKTKHKNGFLPGTLEDKTAPWLVPIFEGVKDSMTSAEFDRFRREKRIEEVPYEFMQGRTFKDAACLIDEAENLDLDDLYITLTRQGDNLNMTLCGDIFQSRIHDSGLADVINLAREPWMESVGIIEFCEEDVVRSRQACQWVTAFNRRNLSGIVNYVKDETQHFRSDPPAFLTGKEA